MVKKLKTPQLHGQLLHVLRGKFDGFIELVWIRATAERSGLLATACFAANRLDNFLCPVAGLCATIEKLLCTASVMLVEKQHHGDDGLTCAT